MASVRTVAILGAGNAGLTAAKYLLAEKRFSQIDIFEQRDCVGGLWKYAPENDREAAFTIPQTSADAPHEKPIWRDEQGLNGSYENGKRSHPQKRHPTFVSPMYDRLETNLPKMIMSHSDMPFPETYQLFPTHQQVLDYLEEYGRDVNDLIQYKTQVRRVEPMAASNNTNWKLTIRRLDTDEESVSTYDAVIVGSGHFNVAFVPEVSGAKEWSDTDPESITHSKFFRSPEDYREKKTLTVGRGSSGVDIAAQIASYCQQPLLVSTRDQSELKLATKGNFTHLPEIRSLDVKTRSATFVNGHVEHNIDRVLFCTGYVYSFPFFHPGALEKCFPEAPLLSKSDVPHGARPHNLYRYIFYNAAPTIAFLGFPQQIVPFTVGENQAAAVARIWAGRLSLPSRENMVKWEDETVNKMGKGKKFLWLKPPLDGQYLNELADWVDSADVGSSVPGHLSEDKFIRCAQNGQDDSLNGDGQVEVHGKPPTRWAEKEFWMRERIFQFKAAFTMKGKDRSTIRTLEELGFDFDKWKKEQETEA